MFYDTYIQLNPLSRPALAGGLRSFPRGGRLGWGSNHLLQCAMYGTDIDQECDIFH